MSSFRHVNFYLDEDMTELIVSISNGFDPGSLTIETVGGVGNMRRVYTYTYGNKYRAESLVLVHSNPRQCFF